MTTPAELCHVCGAAALVPLTAYGAMPRVSSDCRPVAPGGELLVCAVCGTAQKPATPAFLSDTAAIYAAYEVHYQGGGAEQIVFDAETGRGERRAALLSRRIAATGLLPHSGRAIDVGCGNGAFLRALGERLSGWDLYGLELDDRYLPGMQDIPRFAGLVVSDVAGLEGQYGLITMTHALEHFTEPFETLRALRANLGEDGHLFVQVPDFRENPFDLTIADHATHFTAASLEALLLRAGYDIVRLETTWVKKELSVLARAGRGRALPREPAPPTDLARRHLAWLDATLAAAREAAQLAPNFGLFGTSIAATWLVGAVGDRVSFHVDEDTSRQGRPFFGKRVISPEQVPPEAVVFLATAPAVAEMIAPRLVKLGIRPVLPPALFV